MRANVVKIAIFTLSIAAIICNSISLADQIVLSDAKTTRNSSVNHAPDKYSIVLSNENTTANITGRLVAPGYNRQAYTLFKIDTRSFTNGGELVFDISVGNGKSNASFDLFPEGVPIPKKGRPTGSIAGRYDISRNCTTKLTYHFTKGQIFIFGATGNWFSKKGSQNTFTCAVSVNQ